MNSSNVCSGSTKHPMKFRKLSITKWLGLGFSFLCFWFWGRTLTWLELLRLHWRFCVQFTVNASSRCKDWPLLVWLLPSVCGALCSHCPKGGHIQSRSKPYWDVAPHNAAAPPAGSTQPEAVFLAQPPHTWWPVLCWAPGPGWSPPELALLWRRAPGCDLASTNPPPGLEDGLNSCSQVHRVSV